MPGFLNIWQKPNGCAVVLADDNSVRCAVGRAGARSKPRILSFGEEPIEEHADSLSVALKKLAMRGVMNGAILLEPREYQFLVADAPNVQEAELKMAMNWRLKDIIDFPVEQASFDLLSIPGPSGADSRSSTMFAVVARTELLKRRVAEFDEAHFGATVIDIPETAQRNIAALYEEEGRGMGLLFFDATGGLMTVSFGGELYHARRFEITQAEIAGASHEGRDELFGRILLEVQRTLDNVERQFSFMTLTKVLIGPEAEDSGLMTFLRGNLAVAVEAISLESVLEFDRGKVPGKHEQWRFFHLFGCAIRKETTAK